MLVFGYLLIVDSISLIYRPISPFMYFGICDFDEICPFYMSYQIYEHRVVYNTPFSFNVNGISNDDPSFNSNVY